jgi:hypothetical protein
MSRSRRRSTNDLIAELRAEAAKAEFVLLAVGFPQETKFVSSKFTDAQALGELSALVTQGGHPLGFIRCVRKGKLREFGHRVLQEHIDANDATVPEQVLTKIIQKSGQGLEALGAQRVNDNRN